MKEFQETQQALLDIQHLKRAILQSRNKLELTIDSVEPHLVLNLMAFMIAASVVAGVLIWPDIDAYVRLLNTLTEARGPVLTLIGFGLGSLLAVAYGYIYFRARREKMDFIDFNDRHFAYFKNLAAFSDLFVKFAVTALLVMAGKGTWLAPLFLIFIGDLVFQGRLLILSANLSLTLGTSCFVAGILALHFGIASLLAPGLVALVLSTWSLINVLRFRRKLLTAQE